MKKNITMTRFVCEVGLSPATIKLLETRGVITPQRDSAGRRVFGEEEICAVKKYLSGKGARLGGRARE